MGSCHVRRLSSKLQQLQVQLQAAAAEQQRTGQEAQELRAANDRCTTHPTQRCFSALLLSGDAIVCILSEALGISAALAPSVSSDPTEVVACIRMAVCWV